MGWGSTNTTQERLYWDALTIPERIDHITRCTTTTSDDTTRVSVDAVPDEWVNSVDGLTPRHVTWWLGERAPDATDDVVQLAVTADSPPDHITINTHGTWPTQLDDIITHVTSETPHDTVSYTSRSDGAPFVHVFSSFIAYAHDQLFEHDLHVVTRDSVTGLNDQLLENFIELAAETLYTEYRTHLLLNKPTQFSAIPESNTDADSLVDSPPRPTAETIIYTDFVERLHTEHGLQELFVRYPVLGRWVVTLIDQWVEMVRELDARLHNDWDTLVDTFTDTDPNNHTVPIELETVTADSHGHGRTVVEVHVGDTPVMYKPKPVDTEILLNDFLQSVESETGVSMYDKTVVDRDTYGWVEHIGHEPVQSHDTIPDYYRRAGGVLAASYLLFLNDGHYENVVAHGDYPVLLDTETILYPKLSVSMLTNNTQASETSDDEVMSGVYWTGLLEQYRDGGGGANVDINGFVQPRVPVSHDNTRNQWEYTNTDEMVVSNVAQRIHTIDDPDNVPSHDGVLHPIDDHVSNVQHGFTTVLEAVLDERLTLSTDFDDVTTRLVLRDTSEYVDVLSRIQSPDTLVDGRNVTYIISELLGAEDADTLPTTKHGGVDAKRVVSAEHTAITRLDVPRFTVDATTGVVSHDTTTMRHLVETPGVERVRNRFESVTPETVKQQRDIIQLTVDPSGYEPTDSPTNLDVRHVEWETTPDSLRDAVDRIYTDLVDSITDEDGLSWRVRSKAGVDTLNIHDIGDDVYEGRLGIALFFAYYDYAFDHKPAFDLAVELGESVERTLDTTSIHDLVDDTGFGSGVAAYIYGLAALGRVTHTRSFVDTATRLATETDFSAFDNDEHGVMGGDAGLVLSLLALYEIIGEEQVLSEAIQTAESLITQTDDDEWVISPLDSDTADGTDDGRVMTGFAHGTAGVSYALVRLNHHAPDERYVNAYWTGYDYQTNQYDETRRNWPDTREHTTDFMDAWCHGRTGVVTSTYAAASYGASLTDPDIYEDAAATIPVNLGDGPDQLCCGTAGRVNNLVSLSTFADNDVYHRVAEAYMREFLGVSTDTPSTFQLQGHTPRLTNPTLFQGVAGIGYSILRVIAGDDIPNIQLLHHDIPYIKLLV